MLELINKLNSISILMMKLLTVTQQLNWSFLISEILHQILLQREKNQNQRKALVFKRLNQLLWNLSVRKSKSINKRIRRRFNQRFKFLKNLLFQLWRDLVMFKNSWTRTKNIISRSKILMRNSTSKIHLSTRKKQKITPLILLMLTLLLCLSMPLLKTLFPIS